MRKEFAVGNRLNVFGLAALMTLVALASGAGCRSAQGPGTVTQAPVEGAQMLNGDEDRPPIVVYESSIDFLHGHRWQGAGHRRWAPNDPQGKDVASLEAVVIDRAPGSADGTVCVAAGDTVMIDYQPAGGGAAKRFTVKRERIGQQWVPVLSTGDVDMTHSKRRLKFDENGSVKQVTAGTGSTPGKSCGPFAADRNILVFIDYKY
jgi:hypothetical protein